MKLKYCSHDQVYQNEPEIGEVFSKVFSESEIKREDVFITSKLWNTSHRPEQVISQSFNFDYSYFGTSKPVTFGLLTW